MPVPISDSFYSFTIIRDMRKFLFMLVISFSSVAGNAQELKVVSYKELDKILSTPTDSVRVINFWATWCKPCVEELPYFIAANEELASSKIQFIFISLDFASQTTKVKELIAKLGMKGTLLQLNEHGGDWIDQLDKNWSGAIPYTILFLPNGERREHYDAFSSLDELKAFLNKNISN
jgi:thiol-disulfide isomerase/thioredoxin